MRNPVRLLVVAALACGGVVASAVPSVAGSPATNTFVVEKEVTGSVPADATFTVEVTCQSILGPAAAAPTPVVMTFDAEGTPTDDDRVTTPAGTECTATETDSGGAATTGYACAITPGESGLSECGDGGNSARFTDVIGDTATITVTNAFAGTPTTPTTPIQPVTPGARAVQAAPNFTG
jgi:hypothetical protein